eukprot:TRINITY_DN8467_c0_g1_i2.p1 TRINITY_DN8467_c0_g1~~TRINITY_DN8467_c0_g1_i2.p1  ORF type:complete len:293 (-),score=46.35 TRINITY_DN8467_c0_g1_i2:11-862(-)
MASFKFLLYGASGYIGSHVLATLQSLGIETVVGKARLEDRCTLKLEIESAMPTHLVCAAGLKGKPNVDWFELAENYSEAYDINVQSQVDIAKFCSSAGIHCTLISSGFIYNYDDAHPIGGSGFTEEDQPNYSSLVYSKLRIDLEKELSPFIEDKSVLLLRFNMPLSSTENPANILTKCVKFNSVNPIPNSFSVLEDLCPVLVKLASSKVGGVFNFTNPGHISLAEILQLYKEKVNPNHEWTISEAPKNRPSCHLDTSKLESHQQVPNIRSSIEKIFDNWKTSK